MDLRHLGRMRGPLVAAISTLLLTGGISVALAGDGDGPPSGLTGDTTEQLDPIGLDVQEESGDQVGDVEDGVPDLEADSGDVEDGAPDAAESEADSGAPDTDDVQDESGEQVEDRAAD